MGKVKIIKKGVGGKEAYDSFLNEKNPCVFAKINERKKIHSDLKDTLEDLGKQFDIDVYIIIGDFKKIELPVLFLKKSDRIYSFVNRKIRRSLQEMPSFKRKIKAEELFKELFNKEEIERRIEGLL